MTFDTNRRRALQAITSVVAAAAIPPGAGAQSGVDWEQVRRAFPVQQPLMNLNNAGLSPPTIAAEEAMIKAYRFTSHNPDVNMWGELDGQAPKIKARLAKFAGCKTEEVALVRNASEGLCAAIFGTPLKRGDEVLLSDWDYPSMRQAWFQRQQREGIAVAPVAFQLMDDDAAIVDAYARAITPRTRVMMLTHLIHWTGRVLPVKALAALAKRHDLVVIVDGAQSFAHIPLDVHDLGVDFYVASLHKWLAAPAGTGLLIVREHRIDETWPLFAPFDPPPLRIGKFEGANLGTYNSAAQIGILPALDLHESIGTQRVHERLRGLTRYWTTRAADIPGFRLHTPVERPDVAGVSLFSVAGVDSRALEKALQEDFQIRVRFRQAGELVGLRVSPHLYSRESELDHFVAALRKCIQKKWGVS